MEGAVVDGDGLLPTAGGGGEKKMTRRSGRTIKEQRLITRNKYRFILYHSALNLIGQYFQVLHEQQVSINLHVLLHYRFVHRACPADAPHNQLIMNQVTVDVVTFLLGDMDLTLFLKQSPALMLCNRGIFPAQGRLK